MAVAFRIQLAINDAVVKSSKESFLLMTCFQILENLLRNNHIYDIII